MQVTIDGIQYAPVSISRSAIGIAITTHNRPEVLKRAIEQHMKHLPTGALVVVIDDGSNPAAVVPANVKLVRHDKSCGIVASKNASLSALVDAGCEHLFLWDDDAWPIADNWHLPYIESPEPHLAYQFLDLAGPRKINDMTVLHRDDKHIAYTGQRGVMLYYHRSAIDKVGGFDPVYGRGMYEHPDLALRIHNAGLSTWAFADVAGSENLIHSMDEHEEVARSIPRPERENLAKTNARIYSARRDSGYSGYAPYRQQHDVVITSLLTSEPDPQRKVKMAADADLLQVWASSIRSAKAIVLADELATAPEGVTLQSVPALNMSPYFARWLHIYQHLRAHPEYRFVWCTDGTDVEMLREPWAEMEPGKIYVGSEHKTYAEEWMKVNHHGKAYRDFLERHRDEQLLNAGLIGGLREDVMEFVHRIIRQHYLIESHRFWKMETATEMDALCYNVGDRIIFTDDIPGSKTISTLIEAMSTSNGVTTVTVSEPLDWRFNNPRALIRYQDGTASGLLTVAKVGDYELSVPEQPEFSSIIMNDPAIEPPRLIFCESSRVGYSALISEIAPQSDGTCQVTAKEYRDSFYQYDNTSYPGNVA